MTQPQSKAPQQLQHTESAFLKDDQFGQVLAKGLSAVAIARPEDPIEFLAIWLLHFIQKKERKAQELAKQKEVEAERETWAKGRSLREKSATMIIQREWKGHQSRIKENLRKEAELRKIFAHIEENIDEKLAEIEAKDGKDHSGDAPDSKTNDSGDAGKSDQEKQAEMDRAAAQMAFRRSQAFLEPLTKQHIADLKSINGNRSANLILRCALYLVAGVAPKQVNTWEKVKLLIKPYPFSLQIKNYSPVGPSGALEKKRKITRVRRLVTLFGSESEIKNESATLFCLYQWVVACVAFREARDEHLLLRKSLGREIDEDLDEEEELDPEQENDPAVNPNFAGGIDADELVVKKQEIEQKLKLLAEAALNANDADGSGDGATAVDPDA